MGNFSDTVKQAKSYGKAKKSLKDQPFAFNGSHFLPASEKENSEDKDRRIFLFLPLILCSLVIPVPFLQ
jgi:hypothetical protein